MLVLLQCNPEGFACNPEGKEDAKDGVCVHFVAATGF